MGSVRRRAWALVSVMIGTGVLILVLFASVVEQRGAVYTHLTLQNEARVARLQGLLDAGDQLATLAERVDVEAKRLALDPALPGYADFNLLIVAQQLLRDAGLSIQRSEVQPRQESEGLAINRQTFHVAGQLQHLAAALAALQDHEPAIRIEHLLISPTLARPEEGDEQRVQVIMTVVLAEWLP